MVLRCPNLPITSSLQTEGHATGQHLCESASKGTRIFEIAGALWVRSMQRCVSNVVLAMPVPVKLQSKIGAEDE